jgi:hypothetical protein
LLKRFLALFAVSFGAYALFTRVRQAQSEEANWLNVGVADSSDSIDNLDSVDSFDSTE